MKVREWVGIRSRLHPDVVKWLRADAAQNKRTFSSEIAFCIECHIETETKKASESLQANSDASNSR